jgi:hypothetical protein
MSESLPAGKLGIGNVVGLFGFRFFSVSLGGGLASAAIPTAPEFQFVLRQKSKSIMASPIFASRPSHPRADSARKML